jgi:hypothetical protein
MQPIIALWTYPRTISTAFERVMMERGDMEILHEPFSYLFYVHEKKATIPQEFVDPDHPVTYPGIRQMILDAAAEKTVFFKDMAAHCFDYLLDDPAFIRRLVNTFLIRNPAKTIASFYALNREVSLHEIGCEQLCRLYLSVRQISGRTAVVVDADDLENDPEGIMAAYCERIGVEFLPHALTWSPQGSEKWRIWEKWHRDAAQSTGIVKNLETFEETVENNTHLREYYDYHLPYYRELALERIKA